MYKVLLTVPWLVVGVIRELARPLACLDLLAEETSRAFLPGQLLEMRQQTKIKNRGAEEVAPQLGELMWSQRPCDGFPAPTLCHT